MVPLFEDSAVFVCLFLYQVFESGSPVLHYFYANSNTDGMLCRLHEVMELRV